MQEIKIAKYTLIATLLVVMTMFYVSFYSIPNSCNIYNNSNTIANNK